MAATPIVRDSGSLAVAGGGFAPNSEPVDKLGRLAPQPERLTTESATKTVRAMCIGVPEFPNPYYQMTDRIETVNRHRDDLRGWIKL